MFKPIGNIDTERRFISMVQGLQPSVGQQFLLDVIEKEGVPAAVLLVGDLAIKIRHAPIEMQDLSVAHQALLNRAAKRMNRRDAMGNILSAVVIGYTLQDGIKHLDERGAPEEYTISNMLNKTQDGRDIVRGPVETVTGAYLLGKWIGSVGDSGKAESQILAVTNAVNQLTERSRAERKGVASRS